ncbi:hypothetical protein TNCV_975071 [Trichonephila clavipes]|nr:hypothetical protein TNCV_975071 [Trichonephila clavipes]
MKERPGSKITPPQGEAGGRKRPNEDKTRVRHEGENGRAQEGGLNSPKTRSRSTKNAVGRKMLLFFCCSWNEKERSLQGKLTDDTAGVTKLEPALTLIPVLIYSPVCQPILRYVEEALHSCGVIWKVICEYVPLSQYGGYDPRLVTEWARVQIPRDKIILCGDLNARHPSWGSVRADARGTKLLDLTNTNFVELIAPPTPTRFLFVGAHHSPNPNCALQSVKTIESSSLPSSPWRAQNTHQRS